MINKTVRLKKQQGFTLIELLLAIALFALIMLVTYNAITQAVAVRDVVVGRGKLIRAAQAYFTRIESELTAIVTKPAGQRQADASTIFLGIDLDERMAHDRIIFSCLCNEVWSYNLQDSNQIPQVEVGYEFVYDHDKDLTLLKRRQDTTLDAEPQEGGIVEQLWPEIRGINFRFLDPVTKTWLMAWDSTKNPAQPLPQAVEITVWLNEPAEGDDDDPERAFVVGKTIILPNVQPVGVSGVIR